MKNKAAMKNAKNKHMVDDEMPMMKKEKAKSEKMPSAKNVKNKSEKMPAEKWRGGETSTKKGKK